MHGGDSLIEKRLKSYSFDRHRLQSLEDQLATLPMLRSSSDFTERIDTGGAVSRPVEALIEKREAIEERIKDLRRRLIPMEHFLAFLREAEPELMILFERRYIRNTPWDVVADEVGLSLRAAKKLREKLLTLAASFMDDCTSLAPSSHHKDTIDAIL